MKQIYKITSQPAKFILGKIASAVTVILGVQTLILSIQTFLIFQKKSGLIIQLESKSCGNQKPLLKKNFRKRKWNLLDSFNLMILKLDIINGQNIKHQVMAYKNKFALEILTRIHYRRCLVTGLAKQHRRSNNQQALQINSIQLPRPSGRDKITTPQPGFSPTIYLG